MTIIQDTSSPQIQQPPAWAVEQAREYFDPDGYGSAAWEIVATIAWKLVAEAAADEVKPDTLPAVAWADHVELEGVATGTLTWCAGASCDVLTEHDLPGVDVYESYQHLDGDWVSAEDGPKILVYGRTETIELRHPDDARALAAALSQAADRLAQIQAGEDR